MTINENVARSIIRAYEEEGFPLETKNTATIPYCGKKSCSDECIGCIYYAKSSKDNDNPEYCVYWDVDDLERRN